MFVIIFEFLLVTEWFGAKFMKIILKIIQILKKDEVQLQIEFWKKKTIHERLWVISLENVISGDMVEVNKKYWWAKSMTTFWEKKKK